MKFSRLLKLTGVAALCLVSVAVQAGALVRITPTGVAVPDQTILDPVPISADGFRLTFHGGGKDTILDPLLLVFATPQGSVVTAPTLSASGVTNPVSLGVDITLGGTNVYGGSWDTATGYAGVFDNSGTGKAYDAVGFDAPGNDSQNYSNWNAQNGDTAWDLWVYSLDFTPNGYLSHGEWLEFNTDGLPISSFVIGYGCTDVLSSGLCDTQQSTPFTFAGYVVPEPGMLALLSVGLIGFAVSRRSRS